MEDSELQAIRQARLQELEKQEGGSGGGGQQSGGSSGGGQGDGAGQDKKNQEEEMRLSVLSQILSPQARERLSRIRIVKGDRARGVEDMLIRMARSGQIQQKVSEEQLVQLLDQISQQESKTTQTKVVYANRRTEDDDDDEDVYKHLSSSKKPNNDDSDEDDFFD